ncbi:nucleoside-diphosphate kinase [Candidatus Woesearchaeota archaeon]|nr:MAG: nucleoside-diphosphate kinase [Candidatus Woesearchaeota archaeon]
MSMIERTLVLLKPDAVQRCFVGEIITRFERVGLKIVGMKMVWVDKEFSRKHYSDHVDKPFYPGLENFITEGPVIAMVLEGIHAVEVVRKLVGPTEPKQAPPGTIRGDFSHHSYAYTDKKGIAIKNLIHASGSVEDAKKEVSLWFKPEELHSYKTVHDVHTL